MTMKSTECFQALGRAYTYDLKKNECLRVGIALGLTASIIPMAFEAILSTPAGGNPFLELLAHPLYLLLLAHPVLFGLLFGVMGSIHRDLVLLRERDVGLLSGLAMTDPLTGLYNRRFVEEELKNLLYRAERTGGPVSVVFFDVDHFKEVNLKQGHRGGDRMLKAVADALQTVLRQGEILGRYGGDEFLLVVAADLPYASNLAERAGAAVRRFAHLSLSAGVARYREDGKTPEELISAADARMSSVQAVHHEEQSLAQRENR